MTDMDKEIEAVGDAIFEARANAATGMNLRWVMARAAYRAVLEQLREPGEAAVIAVNEFERETLGGVTAGPRLHYSAAWEAMIDAKLAELEEKK